VLSYAMIMSVVFGLQEMGAFNYSIWTLTHDYSIAKLD
jgi:hypothetical protein